MNRLLESGIDCVVRAGFLYLPLLYDPDIAEEIDAPANPSGSHEMSGVHQRGSLIEVDGKQFIKTLSLHSLVSNYEKIGKDTYDQVKRSVLDKVGGSARMRWT